MANTDVSAEAASQLGLALTRLFDERDPIGRRLGVVERRQPSQIERCEPLTSRVALEYQFVFRLPFELERLVDLPSRNQSRNQSGSPACPSSRAG